MTSADLPADVDLSSAPVATWEAAATLYEAIKNALGGNPWVTASKLGKLACDQLRPPRPQVADQRTKDGHRPDHTAVCLHMSAICPPLPTWPTLPLALPLPARSQPGNRGRVASDDAPGRPWIDTGTGPGWSPDDNQDELPYEVPQTPEQITEQQTKGMHDDPELDLPQVPD